MARKRFKHGASQKRMLLASVFFGLAASLPCAAKEAPVETLNLAAADWCPYSCASPSQPGFIAEALQEILRLNGIELTVTVLPWSRAIKEAELGYYDGLLTAVESEAPDFLLTNTSTGSYEICVYGNPERPFTYKQREDLEGKTLGVIQDYSYGDPIDSLVNAPRENEQVYSVSSSKPLNSLVEMVLRGRIDAFAEDRNVLSYFQKANNTDKVTSMGCLQHVEFFTAISPAHPKSSELRDFLNKVLSSKDYLVIRLEAQQRYGL